MSDEPAPAPAVALPFSVRTAALSVLAAVGVVLALKAAEPVAVPLLSSVLLAYALEPGVDALMYLRVPRAIAAVLVFGIALAGVQAAARSAAAHAAAFAQTLPATTATIVGEIAEHRHANGAPGLLDDLGEAAKEIEQATSTVAPAGPPSAKRVTVVQPSIDIAALVVDNGVTVATASAYAVIVALLTFLLLATGDIFKHKLLKLAGPRLEARKITADVIRSIDRQIVRYLGVRLLISAIVATLTAVALWPLGVHHWIAWGLVAGVLNVLPFIGPSVAVAAIGAAAFLQFRTIGITGAAVGLSGLVAMLEGNFLTPWLTGRAGDLNTVAVFVGVLFWGWVWGIWGLVLAVPIMVTVKAAADHIEPLQPLAELLGR